MCQASLVPRLGTRLVSSLLKAFGARLGHTFRSYPVKCARRVCPGRLTGNDYSICVLEKCGKDGSGNETMEKCGKVI